MITLAELRAKPHTSISQIKNFIGCPRNNAESAGMRSRVGFLRLRAAIVVRNDA